MYNENKINNVIKFIEQNSKLYLNFLKKMSSYPSVCDYSSMILGAYISTYFDIDINCVDGEYDEDIHWWLGLGDYIIDFTLNQFYEHNKKVPIIIDNNSIYMKKYAEFEIHSIPVKYINIAKSSIDFKSYLDKIYVCNFESMFG